jgi:Zn-dependent protease with chaperone function
MSETREEGKQSWLPSLVTDVPKDLTAGSRSFRRSVIVAAVGVMLLIGAYLGLVGWVARNTYRLLVAFVDGHDGPAGLAAILLSIVLLALLVGGLLGVESAEPSAGVELHERDQPELFALIHRLADAAGAPRPHRVFLSARVNAAVTSDISLSSLVLRKRQNLELGLGLLRSLTLSELAAVLSHELGHFSQRSTALGRWVYVSRQVAERVIWKRGIFEQFLIGFSASRLFWLVLPPRIMMWSVRTLLGKALPRVELMVQGLSRELELQADLVAVSLTGSDALVHALYRLGPADEAWSFAAKLAESELRGGRAIPDLFALQARVLQRTGVILNDGDHALPPALPESPQKRSAHRVFRATLADAPTMWASHPANRDREDNIKRRYVSAELDERPAWGLLRGVDTLSQRVTERFLASHRRPRRVEPLSQEGASDALARRLDRVFTDARYRGAYFRRAPMSHVGAFAKVYGPEPSSHDIPRLLAELYPASLPAQLRSLREKLAERDQLRARVEALAQGVELARFQGRELDKRALGRLLKAAEREAKELRAKVVEHDRRCRTVHLAIARELGGGWAPYIENLARVVHYATHQRLLVEHFWNVVTRVMGAHAGERSRLNEHDLPAIERSAVPLFACIAEVVQQARQVQLSPLLRERLLGSNATEATAQDAWIALLPSGPPRSSIRDGFLFWCSNVDATAGTMVSALEALELAALDLLLEGEARLRQAYEAERELEPAPLGCGLPETYNRFLDESDSAPQAKPPWWGGPAWVVFETLRFAYVGFAALFLLAVLAFTAWPEETLALRHELEEKSISQLVTERLEQAATADAADEGESSESWLVPLAQQVLAFLRPPEPSGESLEPPAAPPKRMKLRELPYQSGEGIRTELIEMSDDELEPPDDVPPAWAIPSQEESEQAFKVAVAQRPPNDPMVHGLLEMAVQRGWQESLLLRARNFPSDPDTLAALSKLEARSTAF